MGDHDRPVSGGSPGHDDGGATVDRPGKEEKRKKQQRRRNTFSEHKKPSLEEIKTTPDYKPEEL
jgi:hypothetical protein